jgi:hypothetical protein
MELDEISIGGSHRKTGVGFDAHEKLTCAPEIYTHTRKLHSRARGARHFRWILTTEKESVQNPVTQAARLAWRSLAFLPMKIQLELCEWSLPILSNIFSPLLMLSGPHRPQI